MYTNIREYSITIQLKSISVGLYALIHISGTIRRIWKVFFLQWNIYWCTLIHWFHIWRASRDGQVFLFSYMLAKYVKNSIGYFLFRQKVVFPRDREITFNFTSTKLRAQVVEKYIIIKHCNNCYVVSSLYEPWAWAFQERTLHETYSLLVRIS